MKIGIPGINRLDTVLLHQDGDVKIKNQISGEMRQGLHHCPGNLSMALGFAQDSEARRSEQRFYKLPCFTDLERLPEHIGMGGHSKKLINYPPRQIPGAGLLAPILKKSPAPGVSGRILVGGVKQNIGIDNKHLQRSITS